MIDLKSLRDKRGSLIAEGRAMLDVAESESRDLTDEEDVKWKKLFADSEKFRVQIDREETQQELDRQAAELKLATDRKKKTADPPSDPTKAAAEANMAAFRTWLGLGEVRAVLESMPEEYRALQVDIDTAGGFLVPPEQFVQQLIKKVDDLVFIMQLGTVFPLAQSVSLGAPALETDPADADWTAEISTVQEDTDMAFGKRNLEPHQASKLLKVSRKFLRNASLQPESIIRDRLAYKFSITYEKAFMTGTGANQPLGLFVQSDDGISSARNALTGSATEITADGLISAKYDLKSNYYAQARWLFHRDGVEKIALLKDLDNQYLWRPGLELGVPDRLLTFPVLQSEFVPNTFTTGLFVGMLGDFSHYWIAMSLQFELQRLVELFAETSQIGFIGRTELDGMPVQEEAFVRLITD